MWEASLDMARRYGEIPLVEEHRLSARGQRGSRPSADEIVLRHVSFVAFRLRRKVFPGPLIRFGDDLLAAAVVILYEKIVTYDLDYRDRRGRRKRVRFVSYIWKRLDGFIIDFLRENLRGESAPLPRD